MLYELNPYVFFVNRIEFNDSPTPLRSERECNILYSPDASFEVRLSEENIVFHKNSFLFLPPYTPYAIGKLLSPITKEAFVIGFDLTCERAMEQFSHGSPSNTSMQILSAERPIWYADAMHLMEELESFRATWESSEPYAEELCSAKLKIILLKMLAGDIAFSKGITSMRLRRALRYIEAHYAEPITNEEIAASVKLHPYYLSRLLKQECGVGLHRYLLDYRLAVAARMLEAGEDNVENISAQCGFSYSSHFITAFRKAYGMSPKRYAQTHRNK